MVIVSTVLGVTLSKSKCWHVEVRWEVVVRIVSVNVLRSRLHNVAAHGVPVQMQLLLREMCGDVLHVSRVSVRNMLRVGRVVLGVGRLLGLVGSRLGSLWWGSG